ncbi:hypothetical protein ABMA28_014820 [Loxostege sticticalis]|uniref:Secreted protein n=1 Tax=Loxostege sticticalis TaxID=481309 RepID=A0ABD0TCE5_LOXSC
MLRFMVLSFCFTVTTSDVLEEERSSFLGFTHEVTITSSTLELVQQLKDAVWAKSEGDRPVRRYFDSFDTPFVGRGDNPTYNYY